MAFRSRIARRDRLTLYAMTLEQLCNYFVGWASATGGYVGDAFAHALFLVVHADHQVCQVLVYVKTLCACLIEEFGFNFGLEVYLDHGELRIAELGGWGAVCVEPLALDGLVLSMWAVAKIVAKASSSRKR